MLDGSVDTPYRVVTLWRGGDEARIARMFVRHFLGSRDLQHVEMEANLGVCELVSNAIRHTPSRMFRLYMWPNRYGPLFGVWDDVPSPLPRIPTEYEPFPDLDSEEGRGLRAVREIALDMGTQFFAPEGDAGKLVWFQVGARPIER